LEISLQLTCTLTTEGTAARESAPSILLPIDQISPDQMHPPRSGVHAAQAEDRPRLGGALNAGTTRVEPAVPTFKDPPVRARVAQVARPLDQCVVRLDHDK
jgi:hypothetical protein